MRQSWLGRREKIQSRWLPNRITRTIRLFRSMLRMRWNQGGTMSQKDWIIKSVSITPSDKKYIASSGMNFSKFVRSCLRRHQALQNPDEHRNPKARERLGICPPNSQCLKCYPSGTPSLWDWKLFRGQNPQYRPTSRIDTDGTARKYVGIEVGNIEWLLETIDPEISMHQLGGSGNHISKRKAKKGLLRRFLAFIYWLNDPSSRG